MNTSITLFFLMSTLVMLASPFANLPIFSNVMAQEENSYNNYEKSEKYDDYNDNYRANTYQPSNYENGYGYNNDSYGYNNNDGYGYNNNDGYGYNNNDGYGYNNNDGYGYNNNDGYGYNNNDGYGYKDKNKTPQIFPANKVSELGDRWWQWISGININSTGVNPFTDTGQAGCDIGLQDDNTLLFLVGSFKDPATGDFPEHECGIPAGTSILFPIVNVICDNLEDPPFFGANETAQRICANNLTDTYDNLTVNIDGLEIKNPEQYRIDSPAGGFSLTAVENNPVGIPAGNGTGVQDGFWILLKPLKPGEHTITFSGALDFRQVPGINSILEYGATYFLDVQSDKKSYYPEEYNQDYPAY